MQVLITGGSGFLGAAIMPFLVKDPDIIKIHLLIRDSTREPAAKRVDTLIEKIFLPADRPLASKKITPAIGDLTLEKMGLLPEAYRALAQTCTHILHVGASTDFGAPLEESRRINVDGTQKILDFCIEAKRLNPQFVRLDYVSTAYVAGTKPGIVTENDISRGQRFANNYEQSKYEAELLVRSYMDRIATAIERPSIVVGDSRNGFTPHFKVLYWPLILLSKNILPFIPCNPEATLDIVPVDFVAKGIVTLFKAPDALGKTFHLTTGFESNVKIRSFLNDAFSMTSIKRRPLIPLWIFKILRSRLMKPIMSESFWEACDLAAVYSEYIRGTRVKFNNSFTNSFLSKYGVEKSPTWDEYKANILSYCMETKWGKKKILDEFRYRNPGT